MTMPLANANITILYGGFSAEREVSLASGKAVFEALKERGFNAELLDVTPDVAVALAQSKPDIVFNALHGRFGEDGTVQGMLELMGIAYTHSGVLASALAMDKVQAKVHFRAAGIPCTPEKWLGHDDWHGGEPLPRPYVVKPLGEGSSVGVQIVHDSTEVDASQWQGKGQWMAEPYIAGREIQVAVLNGKALGAIEIKPMQGFYDYAAKYTDGLAEHVMPAQLPDDIYAQVMDYAVRAHECLGCTGLTRSDFRYDDTQTSPGELFILETNTQPGMTPLSLAPEIAAHAGLSFADLVIALLEDAWQGAQGKAYAV